MFAVAFPLPNKALRLVTAIQQHSQAAGAVSSQQPCRPAEKPLEEQLLGPDNAVDGLVRRVADGAHGEALRRRLWLALKALCLALDVHAGLRAERENGFTS